MHVHVAVVAFFFTRDPRLKVYLCMFMICSRRAGPGPRCEDGRDADTAGFQETCKVDGKVDEAVLRYGVHWACPQQSPGDKEEKPTEDGGERPKRLGATSRNRKKEPENLELILPFYLSSILSNINCINLLANCCQQLTTPLLTPLQGYSGPRQNSQLWKHVYDGSEG
jgi:hypothetical protein